jgi:dihydropyrimidinase
MYPRKGAITVGADADILVWDPEKEHTISARTHHMRVDYNCYEGMTVRGVPVQVYQRGRKIIDGDEWLGEKGGGKFIARSPHAPVL